MSEIEPHKHAKKEVAPRHIPQEVVPVPIDEVHKFVRDALTGTSLVNPITQVVSGWTFFSPHLRFTSVDAGHTRIELDLVGSAQAEMWLFVQRRAEIDRFFVALQDELDRRERRRPHPSTGGAAIESAD